MLLMPILNSLFDIILNFQMENGLPGLIGPSAAFLVDVASICAPGIAQTLSHSLEEKIVQELIVKASSVTMILALRVCS